MLLVEKLAGIIPQKKTEGCDGYELRISGELNTGKRHFEIDHPSKAIIIFWRALGPVRRRTLEKIVLECHEAGGQLVSAASTSLLDQLYQYTRDSKADEQLLAFYEPILSQPDYYALQASLFLRSENAAGRSIYQLKAGIQMRYGARGNTISNACSAGYFEAMMEIHNRSSIEFNEFYGDLIDRDVKTLFVSATTKVDQIRDEVQRRSKAGIYSMHIHALGTANLQTVEDFISQYRDEMGFRVNKNKAGENSSAIVHEIVF